MLIEVDELVVLLDVELLERFVELLELVVELEDELEL